MNIYSIMRTIASLLEKPVIVVLLLFVVATVFILGGLFFEAFERKYLNAHLGKLIDDIKVHGGSSAQIIQKSGLLRDQKKLLTEITGHPALSADIRETYAVSLLEQYKVKLDSRIKRTDLIAKLGPSFGLLGTLIPLGPGVIALGQGDTEALSTSLLTAFDTTILGLICAVVCIVVSGLRKRWYTNDMSMLTVLMEAIVEDENAKEYK